MNHKFRDFLTEILVPTCIFYTVFSVFFSLLLFASEADYSSPGMTPKGIALIFLFSFLFSLVNRAIRSPKIVPLAASLLHYLGTAVDFCLCFFLFGGYYKNGGSSSLLVFLAFTVIYLVFAVPFFLIRHSKKKKENEASGYRSMFSSKK